jgi:hypothetical protein
MVSYQCQSRTGPLHAQTPGRVVLHTADGVEEIDVDWSEGLYHINVRAFAAAIRGDGHQPPRAPIGSEGYKSRSLSSRR